MEAKFEVYDPEYPRVTLNSNVFDFLENNCWLDFGSKPLLGLNEDVLSNDKLNSMDGLYSPIIENETATPSILQSFHSHQNSTDYNVISQNLRLYDFLKDNQNLNDSSREYLFDQNSQHDFLAHESNKSIISKISQKNIFEVKHQKIFLIQKQRKNPIKEKIMKPDFLLDKDEYELNEYFSYHRQLKNLSLLDEKWIKEIADNYYVKKIFEPVETITKKSDRKDMMDKYIIIFTKDFLEYLIWYIIDKSQKIQDKEMAKKIMKFVDLAFYANVEELKFFHCKTIKEILIPKYLIKQNVNDSFNNEQLLNVLDQIYSSRYFQQIENVRINEIYKQIYHSKIYTIQLIYIKKKFDDEYQHLLKKRFSERLDTLQMQPYKKNKKNQNKKLY